MSANTQPLYGLTPNVASVKIATTSAVVTSDGVSTGSGTNLLYQVFKAGVNGSYVDSIRFHPIGNAAGISSVATTLRIYISTINTGGANGAVGATAAADTFVISEISVPIIVTASSINGCNYFDVSIKRQLGTTQYILVGQHVAQTTNQQWQATAFGSNY
jgi:hypothetical protein